MSTDDFCDDTLQRLLNQKLLNGNIDLEKFLVMRVEIQTKLTTKANSIVKIVTYQALMQKSSSRLTKIIQCFRFPKEFLLPKPKWTTRVCKQKVTTGQGDAVEIYETNTHIASVVNSQYVRPCLCSLIGYTLQSAV